MNERTSLILVFFSCFSYMSYSYLFYFLVYCIHFPWKWCCWDREKEKKIYIIFRNMSEIEITRCFSFSYFFSFLFFLSVDFISWSLPSPLSLERLISLLKYDCLYGCIRFRVFFFVQQSPIINFWAFDSFPIDISLPNFL